MDQFDVTEVLRQRGPERYALQQRYLNPQLSRMLHTIGFDQLYARASGAYLYDEDGREYLDMLAGFGVFALGRHHPVVRQAIHDVINADLADLTQFDAPPLAGVLAERLLATTPHLDRVYFGNSGTEAVEAALKFARYATGRRRIVYCDHAFHGLTAGSLSVNGAKEFRRGFNPLLPDTMIPFGDVDRLRQELAKGDVAGFLIEPIQGKGVAVSPPGFLPAAAELLANHRALLIADEVQCGLGRTGDFYAYEYDGPCSRIWSRSPRHCRAATCRSGRRSAGTGCSRRSTRPWTGSGPRLHLRFERPGHGRRTCHPARLRAGRRRGQRPNDGSTCCSHG